MATNVNKLTLPLNVRAATLIKNAAGDIATIAGWGDYHNKCVAKLKEEAMGKITKKKKKGPHHTQTTMPLPSPAN